jgi:hypothetical protein
MIWISPLACKRDGRVSCFVTGVYEFHRKLLDGTVLRRVVTKQAYVTKDNTL